MPPLVQPVQAVIGKASTFEWGVLVVIATASLYGGMKAGKIEEKLGAVVELLKTHDRLIEGNRAAILANERVILERGPRIQAVEAAVGK